MTADLLLYSDYPTAGTFGLWDAHAQHSLFQARVDVVSQAAERLAQANILTDWI
jgi:hypothetical protein